jgi:hypothetical protein
VAEEIQKLGVRDQAAAQHAMKETATSWGISPLDFAAISSVYRTVSAELEKLDAELRTYVDSLRPQPPTRATLLEFPARRTQIITAGKTMLQKKLSAIS